MTRRRRRKADHVVVVMAGVDPLEPRAHTRCGHCDTRLVIALPVEVTVWAAANNAFIESHANCRPKLQPICNPNEKTSSIEEEAGANPL